MLGVNILNRFPLPLSEIQLPKHDAYLIRILDSETEKQI